MILAKRCDDPSRPVHFRVEKAIAEDRERGAAAGLGAGRPTGLVGRRLLGDVLRRVGTAPGGRSHGRCARCRSSRTRWSELADEILRATVPRILFGNLCIGPPNRKFRVACNLWICNGVKLVPPRGFARPVCPEGRQDHAIVGR
jgi:hypothetical protein